MATVNPYTIETNIEIIPPKTEAKPLTVHAKATAEEEFLQIFLIHVADLVQLPNHS